ncbi:IclR family transcriptional regulator [Micromonospora echinofusca]|uniref:Helix-turn-helix domain-containing protein n=1 Tax=Micromonospora echinofusca TaxID=47858 RepID=A0ABS3VV64_MICEH|nr:helix-turn-helix domain-containing protein [Micromonospora echinofusca]MBO4208318.1 helix-turn-helix domain-containing protein [Micromonospora echinofusca]
MAERERVGGDESPAIQTVQRAARILAAFSAARPRLSLNEITELLGTSKATAHRYTKALRTVNLLRYDPGTARYSLGAQLLALEAAARAGLPIVTAAEPYLDRLVRELDQTVVLSVWNGEGPVVVRCADNTGGDIRLSVQTGTQLDPTRSAQGRIFCAFLPPAEVPGLARKLKTSPELREAVARARQTGIAVNSPTEHGVRVLASGVFEQAPASADEVPQARSKPSAAREPGTGPFEVPGRSRIVAVMAVVGTTAALTGEREETAAVALRRVARELSRDLGSGAPR